MNHTQSPARFRVLTAALCAALAVWLSACQVFSAFPWPGASQTQPVPTRTPFPTRTPRTLETLPATFTPTAPRKASSASVTPGGQLPALLEDFPLFSGAKIDPESTVTRPNAAEISIPTSLNPGELAAFYHKALEEQGWTLRYQEGNPVGGFLQEWKKDKTLLTVEYHFAQQRPVINADARVVDANQALALLLGFPLPNGTEVMRTAGSTIELYVPLDLRATVDHFKKQAAIAGWRLEAIQPTGWCGSRACQETLKEEYAGLVSLEPTPTPGDIKAEYYRVTMPDYTQAKITFLPQRDQSRVYIDINFKNPARAALPVSIYPRAKITGLMPGMAMFEAEADLKDVIKFYEDGLAWLGWEVLPFKLNDPNMYTRSWRKSPGRVVSLSLSATHRIVYGQLTCVRCVDPYFIPPTLTPTPAVPK